MSKLETIKDRYNTVTTTVSLVQNGLSMYKGARNKYRERFMYTAAIDNTAFVYNDIMEYINAKTNTRNFKFLSTRDGIWRHYDSEATAHFNIDNHRIKVELRKPGSNRMDEAEDDYSAAQTFVMGGKDELVFTARDAAGLKALEDLMESFRTKKQSRHKSIYIANLDNWGDWDYQNLPHKTIDSVFLPAGVKEDLIEDIEKFLAKEEKFKIFGMPWHRGYAFYGEPGNGKSSIALAIANHFGMDLFNLPLSTVRDDKVLNKAISRLKPGSILLLEDIDIFTDSVGRDANQEANGPTLAGLLNALDGVATPHGLITIMTTNRFETLDKALVRRGRMDYKLELKAPIRSQVEDVFQMVFKNPLNLVDVKRFDSMADVVDVFKRNLDDEEAARLELKAESNSDSL